MLSTVLNSDRAIEVNIEIMRAFVRLRQMLLTHAELARKLEIMEKKYDGQFKIVFEAIRELMRPPKLPVVMKRKIGFDLKERQGRYGRKRGGQLKPRIDEFHQHHIDLLKEENKWNL